MASPSRTTRPSTPAPARSTSPAPSRASAPATGTARVSGAPAVRLAPEPVGNTLTADEQDLSSGQLNIPEAIAAEAKPGKDLEQRVRLPGLAEGTIRLRKRGETFSTIGQGSAIRLSHPALAPLADQVPTVLVLVVRDNAVTGWVGVGQPGPVRGSKRSLVEGMLRGIDALGGLGLTNLRAPTVVNEFSGGRLNLAVENLTFRLGGYLEGSGALRLDNQALHLEGGAKVEIPGGSGGELRVRRGTNGQLGGDLRMTVGIGPVAGSVVAKLEQGFVHVQGTVGYRNERMSGSITLIATDERTAKDLTTKTDLDPSALPVAPAGPDNPARPGKRAFCGWGELSITLTPWLSGQARVLVNSDAQATILGEIRPQKELILFDEREWTRRLFRVEIRAGYGVPVVGQVFVFANIGMEALARVGPGRLHNMSVTGQFSTDPRVENLFTIQGSLNISAFAGLKLRAEGGVGLTVLGHDIKAGVGLNALAGIRGYVEATPRIGRRMGQNGRPEWFIGGHMEIAAQPFLGFSGDLFVELDSPWWSPAPDKKWTWPLGSLEYPLPGEFGIGADVDYVLGSRKWPTVQFGEVDFDSSKFMTDLLEDNAGKGRGGDRRKQGTWKEGLGGEGPGGAGAAGGRKGQGQGGMDPFEAPVGENMTFSDGHETHRLFIQEDARGTTPMMASQVERIEAKLADWKKNKDLLKDTDKPRLESLMERTRERARILDERADEQAALKRAARNAKAEHARQKGKARKRAGQNERKKLDAVKKRVKEAQTALREVLSQLATLAADEPFTPIHRTAPMHGGSTEKVEIVAKSNAARLRVAGADESTYLDKLLNAGPLSDAYNQTGTNAVRGATNRIQVRADKIKLAVIKRSRINRRVREALNAPLNEVLGFVSTVGRVLQLSNLARAMKMLPIPTRTLTFEANPKKYPDDIPGSRYEKMFRQELKRQLGLQQRGINKYSVDKWLVNLAMFRIDGKLYRQLDRGGRAAVLERLRDRAAKAHERSTKYLAQLQKQLNELVEEYRLASVIDPTLNAAEAKLRAAKEVETASKIAEVDRLMDLTETKLRLAVDASKEILKAQGSSNYMVVTLDNGKTVNRPPRYETLRPERSRDKNKKGREIITYYELRIVGRQGAERAFREKLKPHYDELRKRVPLWKNWPAKFQAFAVLHNPDQVAGGEDHFPKPEIPKTTDYTDKAWTAFFKQMEQHVGISVVNSRIGEQWGKQMNVHAKAVMGFVPPAARAIWRNDFRFVPNPP